MKPYFRFGPIQIDKVDGNSGVYYGRSNRLRDAARSEKLNKGFGQVTGSHNELNDCISVVLDDDVIDAIRDVNGGASGERKQSI